MKATIEFNLPEEKESLQNALIADRMAIAIDRIYDDIFRPVIKHGDDAKLAETYREIWEKIHTHFQEALDD